MNATSNWLAPVLRNRMVMFILAMAVLVPLAFAPVSAHNPALGAALLEGCAIVLLAMLLLRADWRGGLVSRVADFAKSAVNLPVLLFLAVAGASLMMTPDKQAGIQEFLRLGSGVVIYFAIAHHLRRSDQLSVLVDVVLFLCCAISLAGFVQFDGSAGSFATGLFGDHQLYGSCLMALLPVAAAVAVSEKSAGRQLFARCATVLPSAGLLTAHSRGAWIGGAVALTFLVTASLVQMVRKHRSHVHLKLSEVVVPVVLLVIALGFFMFMWPQASSFLGRANTLSALSQDSNWTSRQALWAGAGKAIAQSPLTGKGIGSWPGLQYNYSGGGLNITSLHIRPSLGNQAHNLYLQTAAEVGIPGLLLFLSIPVTLLVVGIRRAMNMDDGIRKTLLLGAMAGTVGVLVDALSSPSWQMGTVSVFFWLLLGIIATCMQPNAKRERTASLELSEQPAARPVLAFAALGLSVLLPTAAVAAAPAYSHIVRCRIAPKTATISAGQSQAYSFIGVFGDVNGNVTDPTEVDLTTNAGTTFSFNTSAGNVGFLGGANRSVYTADNDGGYTASITGTFNDGFGGTCTDTATLTVLRIPTHDNNTDAFIAYGGAAAAVIIWALAHHSTTDKIDYDPGEDMKKKNEARLDTGLSSYGQALPDDSLFNSGTSSGASEGGKTGK